MRLFFDARFTRTVHHDGISRYGASLLRALLKLTAGTDTQVIVIVHDPAQLDMLPDCEHVMLNDPVHPSELTIARRLNALGADVVFSPMQVMGSWGRDYALILTIHDLIYYSHPQPPGDLPAAVRGLWRIYHRAYWPQRMLLRRADAVAVVSRTTEELLARHRLSSAPVHVIANAGDPLPVRTARESGHDAKSLVYMGAFLPYKNVEALIRALAHLPGWTLHLTSRITPQRERALRALIPDRAHVVFHRGVSDEEYHRLLDSATALVTASLNEGFGLPVIEALSRGVPVAVSALPIFEEIAGGSALYFDPQDPADIARTLSRLTDESTWARLAQSGPAQARTFSWEESARRLHVLAQQLHAQRRS